MSTFTITRRLNDVSSRLNEEFKALYECDEFEYQISELKKAQASNRPSVLARLFDMFDACKIKYEKGRDVSYYEKLVKESSFLTFDEIENKIFYALFSEYEKYPTPEQYMLRIVDRLSKDEDASWKDDSLRLRILKQFVKYGNYLKDADINGKSAIEKYVKKKIDKAPSLDDVISSLDDKIFDVLETATKEQKKPGGTYGLIKISDDLALGKFRSGGNTKKALYLFAMVYDMTYYAKSSSEESLNIIDYRTDIEKNLFRDYYSNNLMRFLTDCYKKRKSDFEQNPSGQGINYKNYVEMIYIYFISTDMSAKDKIRLSSKMIKEVEAEAQNNKKNNTLDNKTLYFKNLYTEDILKKGVVDFKKFILENYDCKDTTEQSSIMASSEQKTAFSNYKLLINKLEKELDEADMPLTDCNYGLWFTDVAQLNKYKDRKTLCENLKKNNSTDEIDEVKIEEFISLLEAVNDYLGVTVNELTVSDKSKEQEWTEISKIKTKALFIDDNKKITRTSIIVAYYYYFNICSDNDKIRKSKCFETVFNSFKKGVDRYLIESNYQELDGRNIFDIMVVFSAYAYMNL